MTKIGGHLCCEDLDLCNKELDPVLWDYRKPGNPVLYDKEGLKSDEMCFSFLEWIFRFSMKSNKYRILFKSSYKKGSLN